MHEFVKVKWLQQKGGSVAILDSNIYGECSNSSWYTQAVHREVMYLSTIYLQLALQEMSHSPISTIVLRGDHKITMRVQVSSQFTVAMRM